jgi:hypothetical protein
MGLTDNGLQLDEFVLDRELYQFYGRFQTEFLHYMIFMSLHCSYADF